MTSPIWVSVLVGLAGGFGATALTAVLNFVERHAQRKWEKEKWQAEWSAEQDEKEHKARRRDLRGLMNALTNLGAVYRTAPLAGRAGVEIEWSELLEVISTIESYRWRRVGDVLTAKLTAIVNKANEIAKLPLLPKFEFLPSAARSEWCGTGLSPRR